MDNLFKTTICLGVAGVFFSGCSILGGFSKQSDADGMWSATPKVLCELPATENLAKDATININGKIAVVFTGGDSSISHCLRDGYLDDKSKSVTLTNYFPEEMYAKSLEELDTLIKIESKKGNYITTRSIKYTNSSTGANYIGDRPVAIHSAITEISFIDYKTKTVVAKKQFEDKGYVSMEDLIPTQGNSDTSDYRVADPTIEEIRSYLGQISDKARKKK